jgi:hypothetical protein
LLSKKRLSRGASFPVSRNLYVPAPFADVFSAGFPLPVRLLAGAPSGFLFFPVLPSAGNFLIALIQYNLGDKVSEE